ncbi:MAG: hypothetical protein LBC93_06265, partial [Synergistaceae bacterium]|nr:hypothetical protein [Synergistaceae bacterium]
MGRTTSTNGDVDGSHEGDIWVVKLNAARNIEWQKHLGGSGSEEAHSIQRTSDGGHIVAGYTSSTNRDVAGNHGGWDAWVVKLGLTI